MVSLRDTNSPAAVTGPLLAYLDTGASDTVLDLDLIQKLGLEPIHSAALHVLGRDGMSFHSAYEVEIAISLPAEPPQWFPLTVLGGAVFQTGAVAALGRDYLRQIVFTYDGPKGHVRLRW